MKRPLGRELLRYAKGAVEVRVAAPYVKADALTRVLKDVDPSAAVTCVTRWHPHDIAAGASDVECRTIVRERGGSFWLHPTLHAKYYRFGDVALIGSANLTRSAMGWTSNPNLEILAETMDGFDGDGFWRGLMSTAREIGDEEFRQWCDIARMDVAAQASNDGALCGLEEWRPATREPRNLIYSYRDEGEKIASDDERRAARRDLAALRIPGGLDRERVGAWVAACLLAAPFTTSVRQFRSEDKRRACRMLAERYGLGIVDARRDMETAQNWMAVFVQE